MNRRILRILLGICAAAFLTGCTQIKPDEIGVRTVNLSSVGIVPKDYGPGYHRFLWPLDTWHRFPSTVQSLTFAKTRSRFPADMEHSGPLQVSSSDGDRVILNAEVFFHIMDDAAHRVLQDSGPGDRYLDVVRSLSQDAARVVFGRLHTEDFYDQAIREHARHDAMALLREKLEQRGVTLVDLLVHAVEFDANYENLIKEKKIADQRVELERAKARAAEEQGRVSKIQAETTVMVQKVARETEAQIMRMGADTDMQIAVLRAEADKHVKQRHADADLYKAERLAEGQRKIRLAEANGMRRKNEALSGEGSRNLVAMEALRKMNLTNVTFPSVGYEWFNPYDMAVRIGASGASSTQNEAAESNP